MKLTTIGLISGAALIVAACGPAADDNGEAAAPAAAAPETPAMPESAFDQAVAAIGGAEAIQSLNSVSIEASGQRWELDESPIPGGLDQSPEPFTWTVSVDTSGENLLMRVDLTRERASGSHAASLIINGQIGAITGQDAQFGPPNPLAMTSDRRAATIKEQVLLNPLAYLIDGLANPDAVSEGPDQIVDGANHHVVTISGGEGEIRYFVNAESGLISKAEHMEIDFLRRDVEIEVMYDDWSLTSGGITFPRQVRLSLDGIDLLETRRSSISVNTPLAGELFTLPAGLDPSYDEELAAFGMNSHQVYQAMASIGFPRSGLQLEIAAQEIAPGVHHVTGSSHHSLVVEQENGLVVVEAPLHDLRSEAVLEWIAQNFGDIPITHVVATHHHTDHSAGLRAYAGAGATVVAHELAADFYADIMSRSSNLRPDRLQQNPRNVPIETMPASGSYTIPDAERPVTIYPLPNDHANDMIVAFVENAGVTFVSDIYSPNPAATAADPGAQLLRAAIDRAGIEPTIIAGGHGATITGQAFANLFAD